MERTKIQEFEDFGTQKGMIGTRLVKIRHSCSDIPQMLWYDSRFTFTFVNYKTSKGGGGGEEQAESLRFRK